MSTLNELLAKGGELDPALKRARLQTVFGPDYEKYITPKGDFEFPVGNVPVAPVAGPALAQENPAPFSRGMKTVAMDFLNAGGLLSQAIGQEDWAQALFEKAHDYENEIHAIPQRIAKMEDIHSIKDAAIYGYERIAENVPMIASLFLPAGIVGLGARGVGLSARASRAAGWSSAFLTDVGLQTGESVSIAQQAGQNPEDIRVVGSGIGKAALDFIPFFALANKLGIAPLIQKNLVQDLVEKGFLKRAAGNIGTLIATEVPTEVMQESINISLDRSLQQKSGPLTPEEISQLKNAATAAAAVSLGLGAASGVMSPREATEEELNAGADASIPSAEKTAPGPRNEPVTHLTTGDIEGQNFSDASGFNAFSYNELYDERTGEMTITGKEYQKALIRQGREIKYDPFTNELTGMDIRPGLTQTRTGWVFDPAAGGFTYDRGKGKIQISEQGFGAWLDDGSFLGQKPSLEEAMRTIEKFAYDNEAIIGIDQNGSLKMEEQEASKKLSVALQRQPQMTPTEQALVAVEEARPILVPERFDIPEDERVLLAQLDQGMQKLLDNRMEFLGNKDNYRTTDNQIKNGARATLEKLDIRIANYAKKLGIPNPLESDALVGPEKAAEETFQERAGTEKKKYPNLSDSESQLLDALEEKEREPGAGLTLKEYEKLERLIAKRSEDLGVPASERTTITEAELDQLLETAKKRVRKEYKIVSPEMDHMAAKVSGYSFEAQPGVSTVLREDQEIGYVSGQDGNFQAFRKNSPEPLGSYATAEEAFLALRESDLDTRTDYRRAMAKPNNLSGELASSLLTPARKQMEISIISAVNKLWNSLKIKPKVTFAHSWNTDIFPEGSQLQRQVQGYRGLIQFRDAGHVYMILNNLKDIREAEKTFIHEVLAHYGLRAFFSPKELQQVLELVVRYRGDEVFQHRQANADPTADGPPVGQITLNQAEEFIASKFEEFYVNTPKDGLLKQFVEKVKALFRRVLRHLKLSKMTDEDLNDIMRDIGKALRRGVIANNQSGYWWSHKGKYAEPLPAVIGRDTARIVEGDINTLGETWRAKALLGILTPLQASERFNVEGAKEYLESTMQWWGRKRTLTNAAVEIAEHWQKLPKQSAQRLSAAIFEVREQSDELERRLTPEEVNKIFQKEKVDKPGLDLYTKVDKEFQTMLGHLEAGLKLSVLRQHAKSREEAQVLLDLWNKPDKSDFLSRSKEFMGNLELGARLSDIENQINSMRNRNYFPLSRFGSYAITIRAKNAIEWKGKSYRGPTDQKRGEVVYFETTETANSQKERFEDLKKSFPNHLFKLQASIVSDEEFSFLGMPPALFDLMRDQIKLSDQQQESLKELFYLRSPGRSFLRHLVKRRGTSGYSQDALRVFASYMMNAANHIARIEFNPDLTDHLSSMKKFAEENGNVAGLVSNYFQKHHHYLMNPENDLSQLRALGFLWYLGFNVKSALVNLTQVPMVAYPYLSSIYGDTKAVGAIANAYKRVVDWRRGKSVLSKEMEGYIARGIAEGFLDESRATELAGIAEGGMLHRILPANKSQRLLNNVSYYGSYLFRHAEKFNREVVFLATLELAKSRGLDGENAFKAARKAVQTSMFEYAKWNRPAFMRGKKSVFFLFWNYMQHLNYLAFGGEGKGTMLRVNLMLLMVAGMQGLPFAENILDLLDWGSTEVKQALGSQDPKTDLRADIRELALAITNHPDLVMHGLSRYYGLGAAHMLELLGVPVPKVDVSGSLSAGAPIPGIAELVEPSRDPDKKLGATLVAALGPVVGVGYTFWKSLMNQDPDQWKSWERAMPSALRAASQAIRRSERGEESFRGGGAMLEFDPLNSEHRSELIANSLGFAPTRLSQSHELRSAQEDLRQYWTVRRAMVMENYAWATLSGDSEAISDAMQAIMRFNKDAPAPQLKLSWQQIQQSLRQRTRLRDLREQGLPNEKAFQPLYLDQRRLYGDGGEQR